MSYKRKYKIGEPLTSLDEVMKQDFVYMFNCERPLNIGFVQSLQMRVVYNSIKWGRIFKAERIEEVRE